MRARTAIASVAFVFGVTCFGLAGHVAARLQQAPASRIVLDLPDGFKPARLFTGFVDEALGVSFVILEMPGAAYEQLASGLTPAALATKGITGAEAGKLARAAPYIYMRGEQASEQGLVAKFLVAFRNKHLTALVTANVRQASLDNGSVQASDIERMLASATISAEAVPARELYTLGYLGPFRPAGKILGTTSAYTLDGKFETAKARGKRALLLVAPSLDQRPLLDPNAQAETLLVSLPGLKGTTITDRRQIEIDGMPAVEVMGSATDPDEGGEVDLYQVLVLPRQGGYYRLFAQVPKEKASELMPELAKIAQSFRLVE